MVIVLLLILILLLISLISRFYQKHWSRNLSVGVRFSAPCYNEGDSGSLIETVTNRKFLPLWWGNIQFHLPAFITTAGGGHAGNADYKDTVSAFSYDRAEKKVPFTASARGYYLITSAEILTHDFFFLYRLIKKYRVSAEIYVYPDPKLAADFEIDFRRITGEIIKRQHYIEDPFQFRGIRDYSPNDHLKTVNWGATAKTGQLKVNQYNHTSSQEVMLLLDFDARGSWDSRNLKEDMIRAAAALMDSLFQNGIPVGLATNAADICDAAKISLSCKNGANQHESLLKLLARINIDKLTCPFSEVMEQIIGMPGDTQYILLSYASASTLQDQIAVLRATRRGLQWVLFQERGNHAYIADPRDLTVCEVV